MAQLPTEFLQRIQKQWPKEHYEAFLAALEQPLTSVRYHAKKVAVGALNNAVPWYPKAQYLPTRPSFTWDPAFQSGHYYVQEAGSMLLAPLFTAWKQEYRKTELRVLDACAAPGGKSTLLLDLLSERDDVLVSNEPISKRNAVLRQNLGKWGYTNTLVSQCDFEQDGFFPENSFDCIVVDAPCSGEGMFRKDEGAVAAWSEDNIRQCTVRQENILEHLLPLLKPGGLLLYSTCTYNYQENEDLVQECLSEAFTPFHLDFPAEWNVLPGKDQLGYRCIPGVTESEGFFISAWIKKGNASENTTTRRNKKVKPLPRVQHEDLPTQPNTTYLQYGDSVYAVSEGASAFLGEIQQSVTVKKAGLQVAQVKGKKLNPTTEWATAVTLHNPYPVYAMTTKETQAFLQGQSFSCSGLRGIHQMQWNGIPQGFAKAVGARWNNLRDKKERILSAPSEELSTLLA